MSHTKMPRPHRLSRKHVASITPANRRIRYQAVLFLALELPSLFQFLETSLLQLLPDASDTFCLTELDQPSTVEEDTVHDGKFVLVLH